MDPIVVTIIFKGIAMLAAIGGGILVARYGFHLYRDGAGSGRDLTAFEVGPVRLKAHSVGSVMAASAFLWAWAGVALSPNLDKKGEEWKVYSFQTPHSSLKSLAITVQVPKSSSNVGGDPEKLKKYFGDALAGSGSSKTQKVIELNGRSASYDIKSIGILKSEAGQYLLTTNIKTMEKTATIAFEPIIKEDRIVFVPAGVGIVAGID